MQSSLLAVIVGNKHYAAHSAVGDLMYFALLSTEAGYGDALAALPNATVVGNASHDADLKIVSSDVDEATINADSDLSDLRLANYPTALCRHRWLSAASFNISGQQMLGNSEGSVFGEAGRSAVFIRQQSTYSRTGFNYGNGDGTTHYDAKNGAHDTATYLNDVDYFGCAPAASDDGLLYAMDDGSLPSMAVEDGTGLGAANRLRIASDPDFPAMFWGSRRRWDSSDGTSLPFELYDAANDIYVCGGYRSVGAAYTGGSFLEFDVEDKTLDMITLLRRHTIYGKSSLSDLNGTTGRSRLYAPSGASSTNWDSIQVWDGTTFDDETADGPPSPSNVDFLAVSAPDGAAIYFGDTHKFNFIDVRGNDSLPEAGSFQIGATGEWQYWDGATWSALTNFTDASAAFTQAGYLRFQPEDDWDTTTVNSSGPHYYVRWIKTGGTVTQAASIEWMRRSDVEPWNRVKTFDGSSTYADVTWPCMDADNDDVEAFPVSAADNAAIYWGAEKQFSHVVIDLSQVQVGGTMVLEYYNGSTWAQFTNIVDPTSGLTSGTGEQSIEFNPKIDWATTAVDGDTLYWVRMRKTGGTITTAARLDSSRGFNERSAYVHRWNDTAPVNGWANTEEGSDSGIHFETDGKGNFELHRVRSIGVNLFDMNVDDAHFYSCQYALGGGLRMIGISPTWTMGAAQYGTRWWGIDDHRHQSSSDPFIQNLIAQVQYAIDNKDNATVDSVTGNTIGEDITADLAAVGLSDPDITAYDDIHDWNDFAYFSEGIYGSEGAQEELIFDGHKFRFCGAPLDSDQGDRLYYPLGIDGHSLAHYGGFDGTNSQFKRLGVENGNRMIDYYPQADGNNDKPAGGSGSGRRNMLFQYGYCSGWSGENADGCDGLKFESDGDSGAYDDGTGSCENNNVFFWGFKDTVRDTGNGTALSNYTGNSLVKARFIEFDNAGRLLFISGGFNNNGPRSTNAVTFDGSSTYNAITSNLIDSGNTATELFAAGTAGNILYLGVNELFTRRFTFNITTAGVGSPTLAFEYYNGSTWTAVSNLSDGTSGFTTTGTITFDRPTDASEVAVNSTTRYWARVRIVSGSFSTIPQADEIGTYIESAWIDCKHYAARGMLGDSNDSSIVELWQGVGTWTTNTGVFIIDHGRIYLSEGQDSSLTLYGGNALSSWTLAQWQALSKSAANTDAPLDSVFDPSTVLIGP